MYGFKGRTYRKGRGETIRFYLDINKKICMKYHTMQQVEKNSAVIQANTLIQT
ncbi:MAG: hypothetical protein V8T91_01280 [Ruminococcus sp.]